MYRNVACAFPFTLHTTFELAKKEVAFIWLKEIVIPGSPETDCPVYAPISLVRFNFVTLYVIWLIVWISGISSVVSITSVLKTLNYSTTSLSGNFSCLVSSWTLKVFPVNIKAVAKNDDTIFIID